MRGRLVFIALLFVAGCAATPTALDAAVVTANGAAAVATTGEATLAVKL